MNEHGAIALAVYNTLPADARYSTLDLKITYLRPLTEDSGPDDRLCAHATGTCLVAAPK
jgi:acyl-coenzyme A thioesterase PaaI-like protein